MTNEFNSMSNEPNRQQAQERETLRMTPLSKKQDSALLEKLGVELSFLDAIGWRQRLRLKQCESIIEWTGEQWTCFEREGVRWYPEPFVENDYEVLEQIWAQ